MRVSKAPEIRKNELIEIALELFRNNGYEKTSVEQITKKANVAKGVFYYYFSSKEEIFGACIEALVQPLMQKYIAILTNKDLAAHERIQNYVEYNFTLFEQKRGALLEQALHGQSNQELHDRTIQSCVDELHAHFEAVIEAGRAVGEFLVDDVRFAATALLGALTALHERYVETPPAEMPALKRKVYDLINTILKRRSL